MEKASLVVSEKLKNNVIFERFSHRDNWTDRFIKLKEKLFERGYDLSTQDLNPPKESAFVIYANNMPDVLPNEKDACKSYLILSESAFIKPDNYDITKYRYFRKVFTWSDDLVDEKKIVKVNYSHLFPKTINRDFAKKKKLCVMIAGNKRPLHGTPEHLRDLSLYEERKAIIRWFENNHPSDFDLYGTGWDRYRFGGPKITRALNKVPFLPELYLVMREGKFSSYRGQIERKKPIMEKYWFSICLENAKDIPGYITEKIFDSFFAGCVPIYRGADNITDHVPQDCFIDQRKFPTYERMYQYLRNISENDYQWYLENISSYLQSPESWAFKSEGFAEKLIGEILDSDVREST